MGNLIAGSTLDEVNATLVKSRSTMEKTSAEVNATLKITRSIMESLKAHTQLFGVAISAGVQALVKITLLEMALLVTAVTVFLYYIIQIVGWCLFCATVIIITVFVKKTKESLETIAARLPDLKPVANVPDENFTTTGLKWIFDKSSRSHRDGVTCLISLGGCMLASGSDDCTVKIWDLRARDNKLKWTFDCSNGGHSDKIISLVYLNGDSLLASSAEDHKVKIWNINDGKLMSTLDGGNARLLSLSNGFLAGACSSQDSCSIVVWNPKNCSSVCIFDSSHYAQDSPLASLKNGLLASVTSGHLAISILNTENGKLERKFENSVPNSNPPRPNGNIRHILAIENNNLAILITERRTGPTSAVIMIYNIQAGLLKSIEEKDTPLTLIYLGDYLLATAYKNDVIKIWNIESGKLKSKSRALKDEMDRKDLVVFPNHMLAVADEYSLKICDTYSVCELTTTLDTYSKNINDVVSLTRVDDAACFLAGGCSNGKIKIWNIVAASSDDNGADIKARWKQNGIIVAGSKGDDHDSGSLSFPSGICVDDTGTVYVTEWGGNRVTKWKPNTSSGQIAAGGNRRENKTNQLNCPTDVIIDKEKKNLIICDSGNKRVVQWSLHRGKCEQIIISNIACNGLAMDNRGFLYVSDTEQHCVKRWRIGDVSGTLVAGGNGRGNGSNQLNDPYYICVDQNYSVYVSDNKNHRVMKWDEGAKEGILVAGIGGQGNELTQLSDPLGVIVDHSKTVYVADAGNARIIRWCNGATQGRIVVGGNGIGKRNNQLHRANGCSFDRDGNLYVAEENNHRVQKFEKA